jgi:hypothetical protein
MSFRQHTWSLGIEQFYTLWPLALLAHWAAASFYLLAQPILQANSKRRARIAAAQTLRRASSK